MTRIRALNEQGIERFTAYLDSLAGGGNGEPPRGLLEDPLFSKGLASTAEVDPTRQFPNKLEFGRYLAERLAPLRADGAMDENIGFWSWLALFFFDVICPARGDGQRTPKASYHYILSQDRKHYHRHLVRTPCLVYSLHGERGRVILSSEPSRHGEASEQLVSRIHLFTNKGLFEAMDHLYVERDQNGSWRVKRKARGAGGGSMRRLAKIVRQFDLTFDLRTMTGEEILELLPAEFNSFK